MEKEITVADTDNNRHHSIRSSNWQQSLRTEGEKPMYTSDDKNIRRATPGKRLYAKADRQPCTLCPCTMYNVLTFADNVISIKGNITTQPEAENDKFETVNSEKRKSMYDPRLPYFQSKYNVMDIAVIGAWGNVQFLKEFKIPLAVVSVV